MSEEVMNNVTVTEEPKKVKKKKSKARVIVEWILFSIFGVLFAVILAGNIDGMVHQKENYGQSIRFGFGSFIILTNSMEPEIPKDSAIITYKEDLGKIKAAFEKGAKIDMTFANEKYYTDITPDNPDYTKEVVTNQVMTHRLMEIHYNESVKYGEGRYVFVTAGINEKGEQSDPSQYQIFCEKQYLGVVKITNVFLGNVFKFIVSPWGLIVVLLVPAAYLIATSTIDIFKTLKTAEESEAEAAQTGRLAKLNDKQREQLKKDLLTEMIEEKRKAKESKNEAQD